MNFNTPLAKFLYVYYSHFLLTVLLQDLWVVFTYRERFDDELVLLPEFAERAPDTLAMRDWIGLDPASAGVLVKVLARIGAEVGRRQDGRGHIHAGPRQAYLLCGCRQTDRQTDMSDPGLCSTHEL